MIVWQQLGTGARAVPKPVATPRIWAVAFAGALLLMPVLGLIGLTDRPVLALLALSLLAAALGLWAKFVAAPGTALLCWLFLNSFGVPPVGELSWAAERDLAWLSCLLTATVVGTAFARVANARAAYRRITPATHPDPRQNRPQPR
ncbi:hypothetical protein [Streptomyces sp. NBC_00588]|uniref:hypothetical protein n=1 Tax=Streptomyces sp. NBC_00588 TaxID=2975784 RepID=UPI002E80EFEC|nr:hypothetical protein [Streptomyces sp. NBC_00588]WUB34538.1 hypothetical protein OHN38_06295 [Streptomyces sp. NBC_00588]